MTLSRINFNSQNKDQVFQEIIISELLPRIIYNSNEIVLCWGVEKNKHRRYYLNFGTRDFYTKTDLF